MAKELRLMVKGLEFRGTGFLGVQAFRVRSLGA